MARLRNRQNKATFWTDGELLRWHRDKRFAYESLWAMAEDSGCLEDDPFEWKLTAWSSPMDADITVELLSQWRDELMAAHKLVPYEAEGKRYLFCAKFHQHECPRNPQPPDLPLPPWVKWATVVTTAKDGREHRTHRFEVDTELLAVQVGNGSKPGEIVARPDKPAAEEKEESAADDFADIDFGGDTLDALPAEEPPAPPPKPPANHTDAQKLVAHYIDERTQAGSKPTKVQVGMLAQIVADKLQGGSKPENVREAIKRMVAKGKAPGLLPAFIDEVEAERSRIQANRPRSTISQEPEPTLEERAAAREAARLAVEQVRAMTGQTIGRAMPA